MHQVHHALGHNGTTGAKQCLKWLYYWKGLCRDVDIHVKQYIKCQYQILHPKHYAQLHLEGPLMPTHWI